MEDDEVTEIHPDQQMELSDASKPSCPVCLNAFHSKNRVPKSLTCGHSFCQECIESLVKNMPAEQRVLLCAVCRVSHTFQTRRNLTHSVPTNYMLRDMLEKHESEEMNFQGNSYPCRHCRTELHEKDLMCCRSCIPSKATGNSLDLMGRPKIFLVCSRCIQAHHKNHRYDSKTVNAGRWRNRNLYYKFENSAEAEEVRIINLLKALREAEEATLKYQEDLRETVRQVRNNADSLGISGILKNFLKAADDSSEFVHMSTEFVKRINESTAPQYNMLGKHLFDHTKRNKMRHPISSSGPNEYKQQLANLFTELNGTKITLVPQTIAVLHPDLTASRRPAGTHVFSQNVVARSRQPHIYPNQEHVQPAQDNQTSFDAMAVIRNLRAQQVPVPPVPHFAVHQLNTILNYYAISSEQCKHAFAQMTTFNAQSTHSELANNRNCALRLASGVQYRAEHHENHSKVQIFYPLPFHLLNPNLPHLYKETFGGFLGNIVSCIPVERGRQGVHDYFFTPPFDQRPIGQVCRSVGSVLDAVLTIMESGSILHNILQKMKADLQPHAHIGVPRNIVGINHIDDDVLVLDPPIVPPAPHVVVPDLQIPRDSANVRRNDNNNAEENHIVLLQPNRVPVQDEPAEDFIEDVEQEYQIQNVAPGRREANEQVNVSDDDASDNEGIEQLQRQPRNNYVFQLEDLLIEPPARATRGAKRRADADLPIPVTNQPSTSTGRTRNTSIIRSSDRRSRPVHTIKRSRTTR